MFFFHFFDMFLFALFTFQWYNMILDYIHFKTISDKFIQKLDKISKFRHQGSNVETYMLWCLVVS